VPARAVPEGFHTVNVYLNVPNTVEAIAFYERAFGAKQILRMAGPDGKSTMHAEIQIGDSILMLADENPQIGTKSPKSLGGTASSVHLYVEDADALFNRAIKAGCQMSAPLMDAFWGDRFGKLTDPYGHLWSIATHKEDVSPEEIGRRAAEWMKNFALKS
jgi:PhnB protein